MSNIKTIQDLNFITKFRRMCNDGWLQGWHERNGGNLTYRMTDSDIELAKNFYNDKPGQWVKMGVCDKILKNSFFVSTGSGKFMRNVEDDPTNNFAILEINDAADSYRVVWGLKDGTKPTSEFPTHFLNHAVRLRSTASSQNECRVIYHAHPANIIAMTALLPWDSKLFTKKFWQAMTECVVIFPDGVGVVPWMVPGGSEIAYATSKLMEKYDCAIWGLHGLFVSGPDFDTTFGLMHTIEKAAEIYMIARHANGGSDNFAHVISDSQLRDIGKAFGITINEEFLDD